MKMLKSKGDFRGVEEGYVVGEHVFFSEESEYLPTLYKIKDEVKIEVILKSFKEINYEWVLNTRQQVLLILNMVDLF